MQYFDAFLQYLQFHQACMSGLLIMHNLNFLQMPKQCFTFFRNILSSILQTMSWLYYKRYLKHLILFCVGINHFQIFIPLKHAHTFLKSDCKYNFLATAYISGVMQQYHLKAQPFLSGIVVNHSTRSDSVQLRFYYSLFDFICYEYWWWLVEQGMNRSD